MHVQKETVKTRTIELRTLNNDGSVRIRLQKQRVYSEGDRVYCVENVGRPYDPS